MFGPSGVLPRVLPFTQFYPGFTQLPKLKLGKTVQVVDNPPTMLNLARCLKYVNSYNSSCQTDHAHSIGHVQITSLFRHTISAFYDV